MTRYPILEVNLDKLYGNINTILSLCNSYSIDVAGVIKGFNAIPSIIDLMVKAGCKQIASSRMNQLKQCHSIGIEKPLMLIRIPMACEIEDVITYCDISLNSEKETIEQLNSVATRMDKIHKIILMYDLGDLREGIFDESYFIKLATYIEHELDHIELLGIGTNLSCYGSVIPTEENMNTLIAVAEEVESSIGRSLEIISGGATTSLPLLHAGQMPERINHLRLGEGMTCSQDLSYYLDTYIDGLVDDCFIIKAQIIEINDKPTHPIGELGIDAFGNKPIYVDRGIRKRAILAIGNQDLGNIHKLIPFDRCIEILGGSSDHTIIDIQDSETSYSLGDIVPFKVFYQAMLFATQSPYVNTILFKSTLQSS